jgi:TetR/AcrR family fatty acid metabolism transcriptional regulator
METSEITQFRGGFRKTMSKKEQIRAAAVKIIARDGFFNATTDKIAAEAKVAVGTLYNYFSSKEEILDYIFAVEFQKRYDFYQNMKNWRMDWFLKINGILNYHLQEFLKEPDVATILLAERMNAHRYAIRSLGDFTQLTDIISDILNSAREENKIRPCDVQCLTLLISGFLNELVYLIATTENYSDPKQLLDEFCILLKNGLNI